MQLGLQANGNGSNAKPGSRSEGIVEHRTEDGDDRKAWADMTESGEEVGATGLGSGASEMSASKPATELMCEIGNGSNASAMCVLKRKAKPGKRQKGKASISANIAKLESELAASDAAQAEQRAAELAECTDQCARDALQEDWDRDDSMTSEEVDARLAELKAKKAARLVS